MCSRMPSISRKQFIAAKYFLVFQEPRSKIDAAKIIYNYYLLLLLFIIII